MKLFRVAALVVAFLTGANSALAQRVRPDDTPPPGGRQALEQRFRERFAAVVKERVVLSAKQMDQLTEVNGRFETRRRELFMQERSVRRDLRDVLKPGTSEDQATQERVDRLLQQALKLQRQRIDLLEEEDRALNAFMTPVQRARYFGMQEQMRRRVEEFRRGAEEGDSSGGRPFQGRGMRRRPAVPQP